jgi:hypothetical protein
VVRKGIISRLEVEPVPSVVQVMIHGVPLLERIKKKEVHKIKNFEVVGFLLKTAQEEVCTEYFTKFFFLCPELMLLFFVRGKCAQFLQVKIDICFVTRFFQL